MINVCGFHPRFADSARPTLRKTDGEAVQNCAGVHATASDNVIGIVSVVTFSADITAKNGDVGFEIAL